MNKEFRKSKKEKVKIIFLLLFSKMEINFKYHYENGEVVFESVLLTILFIL